MTRALGLGLLLLVVLGGGWWLLDADEDPAASPEAERAPAPREAGAAPPPETMELAAPTRPRVASARHGEAWSELDEPADWRERIVPLETTTAGRGRDLLEAMGEVAFVRVQDEALLEELGRLPLEDLPDGPFFLERALLWWQEQGYRTDLRYPVVVIGRAP